MWYYENGSAFKSRKSIPISCVSPGEDNTLSFWDTIDWVSGKMNADFSDLRFVNPINNSLLDHALGFYVDSTVAIVTIIIPSSLFTQASYVWMYYNLSTATSVSDDGAVLLNETFDDLDGWSHSFGSVYENDGEGGEYDIQDWDGTNYGNVARISNSSFTTTFDGHVKSDSQYTLPLRLVAKVLFCVPASGSMTCPSNWEARAAGDTVHCFGIHDGSSGSSSEGAYFIITDHNLSVKINDGSNPHTTALGQLDYSRDDYLYWNALEGECDPPAIKTWWSGGDYKWNTYYDLEIRWYTDRIEFFVDEELVATFTSDLPSASQNIGFSFSNRNSNKVGASILRVAYLTVTEIPDDYETGITVDDPGPEEEIGLYRLVYYIEDDNGDPITSGQSPIAIRDADQSNDWVEGVHIANGLWAFDIPSGWSSGIEIGVNTSGTDYTRETNLSGGSGNDSGFNLVPLEEITVG